MWPLLSVRRWARAPNSARLRRPQQLGHLKGDVQRLSRVQPRVAERRVVDAEVALGDRLDAADALGDVASRELEVDAAGPDALAAADVEEAAHFAHDVVEAPGLDPVGREQPVAVHRVAGPDHGVPRSRTAPTSVGSKLSTRSAPRRTMSVSRPGSRLGSSRSQSATSSSAVAPGPSLQASGFWTPEKNSTWASSGISRALTDPQQMGRAVVPLAGQAVAPRQALLVRAGSDPRGWSRDRPHAADARAPGRCRRPP